MELRQADEQILVYGKEWLEDKQLRKALGVGPGAANLLIAKERLENLILNTPPDTSSLGVWAENLPVGYIIFTDINSYHKTADIHFVIDPQYIGKGLGRAVLRMGTEHGFKEGLFRLEFKPLKSNKGAVNLAPKVGYTREGYMKDSLWTGSAPVTQVLFRILRNEWEVSN